MVDDAPNLALLFEMLPFETLPFEVPCFESGHRMMLRTRPRIVTPPWGGRRLGEEWGKGEGLIGETWEVWADNEVTTGEHAGKRLGDVVDFPLLIKLLEVEGVLSVQVHPDDAQAAALSGEKNGKAEGWYILDARDGAKVAWGLRHSLSEEQLRARALSGEIEADLRWLPVARGDVVDVPPGTIHTLTGGVLLYEVQQPSDLTYRLYDWGRPRTLHLEQAVAVARREPGERREETVRVAEGRDRLLERPAFFLDRLVVPGMLSNDAWVAVTAIEGQVAVDGEGLARGETGLLPPGQWALTGNGQVLVAGARGPAGNRTIREEAGRPG